MTLPIDIGEPVAGSLSDSNQMRAGSLLSLELWAKGSHTIPSQTQLAIVALKDCPHASRPRGFPGTVFGVSGYR